MKTLMKKVRRSFILVSAGAALGYFFDPDSDEQRRVQLGEQLRALMENFDLSGAADDRSGAPAPAPAPTVEEANDAGLAEDLLHQGTETNRPAAGR